MKPAYGIAPLPASADTQPRSDAPASDRARCIPAPVRGLPPMPWGHAAEALVQAGARESAAPGRRREKGEGLGTGVAHDGA